MSREPVRSLGKYELLSCLGRGGMAEVWKAFDPHLRRHVAIKLIRTEKNQDPDFLVRFEREAKLIASLSHPNIVKIHDFQISQLPGASIPITYMVMDYVKGQTLSDYIRATAGTGNIPSWEDIVYLFSVISRALDYAHQRGMLHRDIKPANILLDQRPPIVRSMGEPILTDFGVARMQDVQTGTLLGSLIGTPLYMAPEQALEQYNGKSGDLYSLGIILYEITTGVTPFRGNTALATIMQHVHASATPPERLNPRITPPVSEVILRSIAKHPEDRYPSAIAMTIALAQALNIPTPSLQQKYATNERHTPLPETMPWPLPSPNTMPSRPLPDTQRSLPGLPAYGQPAAVTPAYFLPEARSLLASQPTDIASPPFPPNALLYTKALPQEKEPPRFKYLTKRSLLLSILLIILLVTSGISFMFFQQTNPPLPPPIQITGHIVFTRSATATANNYDQIEIDMHNIQAPSSGYVYYAWLLSNTMENNIARWQLPYHNGSVHLSSQSYPGYANLLIPNIRLLVTREDASSPPMVPYPDPSAHLYYAQVTTSSRTSFDIEPCPTSQTSGGCL